MKKVIQILCIVFSFAAFAMSTTSADVHQDTDQCTEEVKSEQIMES